MSHRATRRRRRKPRSRRQTTPGAAPGTLKAPLGAAPSQISLIVYHPGGLQEPHIERVSQLREYLTADRLCWINVDGLGDAATIRELGHLFGLHPLALEDVLHIHQRPKADVYDDCLYIVTRMTRLLPHDQLESEQLSMFLGANYVLTFQEQSGDCFDPVRQRLRTDHGRIRREGSDYLAYCLIDAVIDSYFPLVDRFADSLDQLEDVVWEGESGGTIGRIHDVRNDLLMLRRQVRPHRECLGTLVRDGHSLIRPTTRIFLRDCYDHTIQLIELLEVYREMCADLRDYHLAMLSNRMNEVMKVLTIIATIFIPLSFIAGLYGMNFNTEQPGNMPELNLPYGYVYAVGLMATVAGGMLYFFRRKGWIG